MLWTPAEVETLRSLVEQSRSGRQIGIELGCTKNSVIGKCFRLGLKLTGGTGGKPAHKAKAKAKGRRMIHAGKVPAQSPPSPRPAPPTEAPEPKLLSVLQLTDLTCKWPLGNPGEPGFGFCGHRSLDGMPYCEYHAGIAFNTPDPRRLARAA